VADADSPSKKGKLTRGKAILIGVLAVVLLVVLYVQFGGRNEKPSGAAAGYRPPSAAVAVQPVTPETKPVTPAVASITPSAPVGKGKDIAVVPMINETHWKSPPLATVVAYDPFALPPAFPQPPKVARGGKSADGKDLIAVAKADDAKRAAEAVEQLHLQLEELKQQGVHVVVRQGDHYVAVVGDRVLHVGDEINGFTVTSIDPADPDGVVHIERKESP
jgi:hypothetical protein